MYAIKKYLNIDDGMNLAKTRKEFCVCLRYIL